MAIFLKIQNAQPVMKWRADIRKGTSNAKTHLIEPQGKIIPLKIQNTQLVMKWRADIRKGASDVKTTSSNRKEKLKSLFRKISVIPLVFLLFMGCSQRQEFREQQPLFHFEFPPYTRHLKGFKICLDPGHGGQGHVPDYKRGPTGGREAEVNLQVAFHLREMLQAVGGTVIMTRVDDSYVSLPMRSQIANESDADFFISLHHNGIDNPKVNYTSTWYHGDADDSRQSLDSRSVYSARGLGRAAVTHFSSSGTLFR